MRKQLILVSNNIQLIQPLHECADAPLVQQTVEEKATLPMSFAMPVGIAPWHSVASRCVTNNQKLPCSGAPRFIEDRWCTLVRFVEDKKTHQCALVSTGVFYRGCYKKRKDV